MFVFVVASTFGAEHKNKSHNFFLDALLFTFKLQVNKKQLQVCCKLWTEARPKREKKKSK